MDRRDFLKKCALGTGTLMLGRQALYAGKETPGSRKKLNVLFVLVDQWRYSAMNRNENHDSTVQTPNLNDFAEKSFEWTRCYAAHPLCTPNRATIITGRWPWQTGMNHNNLMLPPSEKCIAHQFNDNGYRCHYIGKWHMDGADRPGFVPKGWRRRGFTTFEGFNRGHRYLDSKTFTDNGTLMKSCQGKYEPTIQTDLAIEFMKENKNTPFFCFISWGPPHTPYKEHPKQYSYRPSEIELRPNVPANSKLAAGKSLAQYYAQCTALDYEFGRLIQTLDNLDIRDNTLVVFTADHGDMHHSHNLMFKQHPQEESWHVPLLMGFPSKFKAGRKISNLVSSADIMPTVLSLCGITPPDTCTGKDKSAALSSSGIPDESVYGGVSDKWRAIVKGEYKLVVENKETAKNVPTMLYNLKKDPYELNNLIDNPADAAVKKDLLTELDSWKKKTSDSFPAAPKNARGMYKV